MTHHKVCGGLGIFIIYYSSFSRFSLAFFVFSFSYIGQGDFSSSGFLYLLYTISLQSHMISLQSVLKSFTLSIHIHTLESLNTSRCYICSKGEVSWKERLDFYQNCLPMIHKVRETTKMVKYIYIETITMLNLNLYCSGT